MNIENVEFMTKERFWKKRTFIKFRQTLFWFEFEELWFCDERMLFCTCLNLHRFPYLHVPVNAKFLHTRFFGILSLFKCFLWERFTGVEMEDRIQYYGLLDFQIFLKKESERKRFFTKREIYIDRLLQKSIVIFNPHSYFVFREK